MKKLAFVLCAITLLAAFLPRLTTAQPERVPHEDPAMSQDVLDSVSLMLFYVGVFNAAAGSQYQDAQAMLNEVKHATLPADLRFIIDRYNDFSSLLFARLDYIEDLLNETSTLLERNQAEGARQKLDAAQAAITEVKEMIQEMEATTTTIIRNLGVLAPFATARMKEAYDRLSDALERIKNLIARLEQMWRTLREKYASRFLQLTPTELSLNVTPASAFVGDEVVARGRLTSGGVPLPGRSITVYRDNTPVPITTDADGSFSAGITLPYTYVSSASFQASYMPSGPDVRTFMASQSREVTISVLFYLTDLQSSAPGTAYPGRPFTVSGRVASVGDIDRTLRVYLDNTRMEEAVVKGNFSFTVVPPPQTPVGGHRLMVQIDSSGRHIGASNILPMVIDKLQAQADVETPGVVVLPGGVKIKGRVYYRETPLQDALVTVSFKNYVSSVRTSADGRFEASLDPPIDLSLVGPQRLSIAIEPDQPWYAGLQMQRQTYTVSSTNLGLMLIAFLSLGLLARRMGHHRTPVTEEEVSPAPARISTDDTRAAPEPPAPLPSLPVFRPDLTGANGRIVAAYVEALRAIIGATGMGMAPHLTLREYLKMIAPVIPDSKVFGELTRLAEFSLYSGRSQNNEAAARAEQLAIAVKEGFRGAA
ncbi:MAG: hypothetical protein HYX91_01640 [Chloroflexi bacterium]|nr:hypothetical protein [Chloroflexota bacterium]